MASMARHPRGMGPLRRSGPNGKWWFRLDADKRVSTPYAGNENKKAAEAWRRKYLAEEASGQRRVGAENATINDLLDLAERDAEQTQKSSRRTARSHIVRLRAALGSIRLADIRDGLIEGYVKERLSEGRLLKDGTRKPVAVGTVNRELAQLRRAFNLGLRQTPPLLQHAPRVRMMRESNVRTQRVDRAAYERICAALPDAERWLVVLGYHMGWRFGRLVSLTWEQVDFEAGVIRPPAGQQENKRVGAVPIYGDMQAVLAEALRSAERTGAGTVVHRPSGRRVVNIRKAWRRATKAAGCEGLRFHDLRACAASTMADAGIPIHEVMRMLGHKTLSMAMRYDIVSVKRLRSFGEQIEQHQKSESTERRLN